MNKLEELAISKYDLLYEQRMTRVESTMENVSHTLQEIKLDLRDIKSEMKDYKKESHADFRWNVTTMIGFAVILISVMAKGFGWFH